MLPPGAPEQLGAALTKRIGQESSKAELLRYTPGGQQANRDNRLGKVVARDSTNYASVRVRTLPSAAQLDASSNVPVMEQLGRHLTENSATIIRLFQDWDEARGPRPPPLPERILFPNRAEGS